MLKQFSLLAADESQYFGGVLNYGDIQPTVDSLKLYITKRLYFRQTVIVLVAPVNITAPTVTPIVRTQET